MSIFLCGDVHGHYQRLIKIGKKYSPLVVLGDIGFEYEFLQQYDSSQTYLLGGNHDNYKELIKTPNYLGDSGLKIINGIEFFFVRGALSIDQHIRTKDIDWWNEEELNWEQCNNCMYQYYLEKPNIVLSHDFPISVLNELFGYNQIIRSTTGLLLDELLKIHRPKLWCGGHHHVARDKIINGTRFICLAELEVLKIIDSTTIEWCEKNFPVRREYGW